MQRRFFPRIDPDTMVWVSLGIHAGWSHALFKSPGLFETMPIYRAFGVLSTSAWMWLCLGMALLLALGLRWRPLLPFAHFGSFVLLALMALVFFAPNGESTASNTYAWLSLLSVLSYVAELVRLLRLRRPRHDA